MNDNGDPDLGAWKANLGSRNSGRRFITVRDNVTPYTRQNVFKQQTNDWRVPRMKSSLWNECHGHKQEETFISLERMTSEQGYAKDVYVGIVKKMWPKETIIVCVCVCVNTNSNNIFICWKPSDISQHLLITL